MHQPEKFRPACCPHCQSPVLWGHGSYPRKPDREGNPTLNPIPILRFYCPSPSCGRTCSVLPECIAPRRWYPWKTQENCLKAVLSGEDVRAIERQFTPSRQTIARWMHWAVDRFKAFCPDLRSRFPDLGYESDVFDWWERLFEKISLSAAMVILNANGIVVP